MKVTSLKEVKLKRLLLLILLFGGCGAAYQGMFHVLPGNSIVIVAAPHGESDLNTDDIVKSIAARTGFNSIVVANGTSLKTRYNVNRPTVGGRIACGSEPATDLSREVYENYRARVLKINPKPALYVEIHGEAGDGPIEAATKGLTEEGAVRLKRSYSEIRDSHLKGHPELFKYELVIEPADKIRLTASCAKKIGIFRDFSQVIHLELPRQMRSYPYQEMYSTILADFLSQAAAILVLR